MKAVVMAGGTGSRLRPLTIGRPKPMIPLVNHSVLTHILELLRANGIRDVVMTLQYMATMIQDYYGDGSSLGVRITYAIEDTPLGTAGSVRNASRYLDEPFLVISGDALTDFDLRDLIAYHQEHQALATIALSRVPEPLDYGVIVTDTEGRIKRFQEKPSWGELASDTVNTGIYVLQPEVLDLIPVDQTFDWGTQVFPRLLADGAALFGCIPSGYWCDIGNFSEYRRATADLLHGRVRLASPFGQRIGDGIWVGKDVQIAPDAQLFGPIYLGNEVKIKSGVVIHGPAVVRDFTIVDDRAEIDRSIIWRNCYIGEGVELRGAIVGRQCSLKAKSIIYEDAIVGENCVVGEASVIHHGVKLWPGKEVDRGAIVKNSIIWGSQGRRVLFGRHGVTGVVNVDLTPEFAAKLGAAFGATLPKGSEVTINRDPHPGSRMIKRAVISGLPSAGQNVWDLQTAPIPLARFYTAATRSIGGVHVRVSPFDPRVVDIRIFGSDGLNLSKSEERNVERVFFREDFRRAAMDEIGEIMYARDIVPFYTERFLSKVNSEAIRKAGLNIVVDYAFASTSLVLPDIFQTLRVNTTPLGARVDDTFISLPPERFQQERRRMAAIVETLGSDLGVRLDVGGERIYLADDRGQLLSDAVACAVMADLALRAKPGSALAVPVNQSSVFDRIAERHRGHVVRTQVDTASLMQVASSSTPVLAADGAGAFIFPDFQPVPDALMAVIRLLQYLAIHDTRLSDVIASLPPFHVFSNVVQCSWENKGAVMRLLNERFADAQVQTIDGVKVFLNPGEWVLIRPDPDRPMFHVTAESSLMQRAQTIVAEHVQLVEVLRDGAAAL